ncbi:MAG: DNA polymerase III subunit delta [Chloroflexi bacterium]|nr:DNA polymerase III subunit delta [Chloroflexota bacterium]
MTDAKPTVYLLHGEDDYAIGQFIRAMQDKLGDPATAEMNTTRLEGAYDLETLRAACYALPFLAERRLVLAASPARRFQSDEQRQKFTALLESLPPSTALVLTEERQLDRDEKGRPVKKKPWLLAWAEKASERAFVKAFGTPKGGELVKWILAYAKSQGGEFERPAAARLAELFNEEPRAAAQEVDKLLAYANFQRPVAPEDVDQLAAFYGAPADYFALIDAIAARDGRAAMNQLGRLLAEQDGLSLFFSLVGHFRLLVQAREVIENGGQEGALAETLGIHPFRARKLAAQARTLSAPALAHIYRRLLDYDVAMKTGQMEPELALETLVAGLTAPAGWSHTT